MQNVNYLDVYKPLILCVMAQHTDANCEKERLCTSSVCGLLLLPSKFIDELEVLLLPTALDWSFMASSFQLLSDKMLPKILSRWSD